MTAAAMFESEARGLPLLRRGKVRDVYQPSDEHLLIVACDRISAFDSVLPTPIPDKGKILTQISNFWFEKTEHIIANHIVDPNPGPQWYPELDWYYPELDGRTVLVRSDPAAGDRGDRARLSVRLGLEGVSEAGHGLRHHAARGPARSRTSCPSPSSPRRPRPQAGHDENISFEKAAALVGAELAAKVRDTSLALYRVRRRLRAASAASSSPTPSSSSAFSDDGELILIDEMLTPDSSRFWPAESYEPGGPQASFDKQYVRDYLEAIKWNKEPPAPALPAEVVEKTREKYWEAVKRLTAD